MPVTYFTKYEAYGLAVEAGRLYADLFFSANEILRLFENDEELPQGLEKNFL